jgi:hypothetical protein
MLAERRPNGSGKAVKPCGGEAAVTINRTAPEGGAERDGIWRSQRSGHLLVANASITSVGGEAIESAGASGIDQRLLAAPLAHMRGIP